MKRTLGLTGIEVFAIGLGAMPLSIQGRPPEEDALRVIHAALDAGVDFIDTANVYCLDHSEIGHNERLIRKAIETFRKATAQVKVATKGGLARPNGEWINDGAPAKLRSACEQSLRDLKVDSIFLYQLHALDDQVPLEDSVGELAKLQQEGKIQYIGLSNVNQDELNRALKIVRIESVQNRCNVFHRVDFKNGFIDFCRKNQITYIPYSPVGGGRGKIGVGENPLLIDLAQKYETSPHCVALSWLLHQAEHLLPIPGASRIKSIQDNVKSVSLKISTEDLLNITRLR